MVTRLDQWLAQFETTLRDNFGLTQEGDGRMLVHGIAEGLCEDGYGPEEAAERIVMMASVKRPPLSITSFSFKRGDPPKGCVILDARGIRNPHQDKRLRKLDGRWPQVQADVFSHPEAIYLLESGILCLRAGLNVAYGCSGGTHRSVALAEALFLRVHRLTQLHVPGIALVHRDLPPKRHGPQAPSILNRSPLRASEE